MIEYFIPKSDISIRFYADFQQKLSRLQKAYPQPARCPHCERRTPIFVATPIVERDDENLVEVLKGVEWVCQDCWQILNLDTSYQSVDLDWLVSWYATVNRTTRNWAIYDLVSVMANNRSEDYYKSDLSLLKSIVEGQNV